MNIAVVLGSRNPEGQTARAARALLRGVVSEGGSGEEAFLPQMQIERCRQCENDGWGTCRSQGECTIEDDFAALVAKIKGADAVVYATPVYFSDLSESTRAFLDRLRRTCMHATGKEGIAAKPAVGICVAGGGGGGASACAGSLASILRRCGFEVVDMLPVRRQNLEAKSPLLESTGRWLAGLSTR